MEETQIKKRAKEIFDNARALWDKHLHDAEKHGELFNIFNVLKRTTDEVNGHSAFIAELLDPRGSHGQKGMFLKLFLETFFDGEDWITPDLSEDEYYSKWSVRTEFSFSSSYSDKSDSRADIIIQGPDVFIAIENKIYSGEGWEQIKRYESYVENKRETHKYVIYLSLGQISDESTEEDDGKEDNGGEYNLTRRKNYKDDILPWLEECIKAAALLPPVREPLAQYLKLVSQLTKGGWNKEMVMNIADMIKNADDFNAALQIHEAITQVKIRTLTEIFGMLKKELMKAYDIDESRFMKCYLYQTIDRVKEYYRKKNKHFRCFGIGFHFINLDEKHYISFVVDVGNNLYYGFRLMKKGNDGKHEPCDADEFRLEADKLLNNLIKNEDLLFQPGRGEKSYIETRYPDSTKYNFNKFENNCKSLVDEGNRERFVKEIMKEIVHTIDKMASLYPDSGIKPYNNIEK